MVEMYKITQGGFDRLNTRFKQFPSYSMHNTSFGDIHSGDICTTLKGEFIRIEEILQDGDAYITDFEGNVKLIRSSSIQKLEVIKNTESKPVSKEKSNSTTISNNDSGLAIHYNEWRFDVT